MNLAGQQSVHQVIDDLMAVLFPGCHGLSAIADKDLANVRRRQLNATAETMRHQITQAFQYQCTMDKCTDCDDCQVNANQAVAGLINSLPQIQSILQKDIVAAYEGDPAAKSTMEVVMSYPGVFAIIVHRIAHVLQTLGVPLIPRIMSEFAHSKTGIDIHPGASIGEGFFVDHGTGVVIGETCVIGKNVKLYQGVTLGAVSFEKDEHGNPVKGIKRHPNLEDNVVIYAEATILGNITIGKGSEIGGNVWLTHSIPPGSKVYNLQPQPLVKGADGSWKMANGPWTDIGTGI
ncbi:MAG: serine acetyltransferase [Lentisphaerae bacterium]|nr:serine acetyltransferase [Lentisphaerota bacterium]